MAEKIKVGDTVVCIDVGKSQGIPHTADTQALHLGCQYTVSKVYELSDGRVYGVFLNNYHGGWWLANMFEKYQKPEPTDEELAEAYFKAADALNKAEKQFNDAYAALEAKGWELFVSQDGTGKNVEWRKMEARVLRRKE